jgi:K+-transporting ATPase ATPase C chain
MVLVGQVIFPYQANGSLIRNPQGEIVGSALIGQPFTAAQYFNSRPSAYDYSTANPNDDEDGILKTGVSGASNLAPSNPDLLKRIQADVSKLKQAGIQQPTADLVYTSGSSLDPHITPEAANTQVERIARARSRSVPGGKSLSPDQVQTLIDENIDSRFLGIFGESGVNLLKLNLALDNLKPAG